MKRRFVFCLGAMLSAGTLAAQTPVPEWQAGVDKVKSLIKANPEQASDAAGELLKGKNKKNVELVTSVARAYLDAGQLKEAETYLEMARKADNKAPAVSVLEGDIAFARKDIGKACQLYEQAIYFDSNYKDAYLKYAQAYKSASPSQAIEAEPAEGHSSGLPGSRQGAGGSVLRHQPFWQGCRHLCQVHRYSRGYGR